MRESEREVIIGIKREKERGERKREMKGYSKREGGRGREVEGEGKRRF